MYADLNTVAAAAAGCIGTSLIFRLFLCHPDSGLGWEKKYIFTILYGWHRIWLCLSWLAGW